MSEGSGNLGNVTEVSVGTVKRYSTWSVQFLVGISNIWSIFDILRTSCQSNCRRSWVGRRPLICFVDLWQRPLHFTRILWFSTLGIPVQWQNRKHKSCQSFQKCFSWSICVQFRLRVWQKSVFLGYGCSQNCTIQGGPISSDTFACSRNTIKNFLVRTRTYWSPCTVCVWKFGKTLDFWSRQSMRPLRTTRS